MSDDPTRSFIDTNIWLYAFIESDDAEKTAKAKRVIDASQKSEDMHDGLVVEGKLTIRNPVK